MYSIHSNTINIFISPTSTYIPLTNACYTILELASEESRLNLLAIRV